MPLQAQEATPELRPTQPAVIEQQPDITLIQPQDSLPAVVVIDKPIVNGELSQIEIVLLGVLLIVVVGGGVVIRYLILENQENAKHLANALPMWAWEFLHSSANQGFATLETVVANTPNAADDDLLKRVVSLEQQLYAAIKTAREVPPIPPVEPPAP